MSKETLLANLREIPDFPIPGILFYDVTTLFKSAECMQEMLDTLYEMYKDKGITKVVGIESRGFIMGGALAARLGAGFVMARKPGKLLLKFWRKHTPKNTAPIPSKYTRMPSVKRMLFCCTTIYWLQAEQWQPPTAWYKNVVPRKHISISL